MDSNDKGFTLVEIIVVITIIGILLAIALLLHNGHIEKTRRIVCEANRAQLDKMHAMYLIKENKAHTEIAFGKCMQEFDEEICPDGGIISYRDGSIICSIHSEGNEDNGSNNGDDGSVPFLWILMKYIEMCVPSICF